MLTSTRDSGSRLGSWIGYLACGWAWLFAVPSVFWGLGGTFGRNTIGREAVPLTWSDDPLIMAVVLFTGVLKIAGGALALGLVQDWGRRIPRWMLLVAGWGATCSLIFYGSLNLGLQSLVATRRISPPPDFDWYSLYWHLYLWSPWFLLWGILLGLTTWHYQRRTRLRERPFAVSPG